MNRLSATSPPRSSPSRGRHAASWRVVLHRTRPRPDPRPRWPSPHPRNAFAQVRRRAVPAQTLIIGSEKRRVNNGGGRSWEWPIDSRGWRFEDSRPRRLGVLPRLGASAAVHPTRRVQIGSGGETFKRGGPSGNGERRCGSSASARLGSAWRGETPRQAGGTAPSCRARSRSSTWAAARLKRLGGAPHVRGSSLFERSTCEPASYLWVHAVTHLGRRDVSGVRKSYWRHEYSHSGRGATAGPAAWLRRYNSRRERASFQHGRYVPPVARIYRAAASMGGLVAVRRQSNTRR